MPPVRKTYPIDGSPLRIEVTDDGSRTLIHSHSRVAYHSGSGALAETQHVYLGNSSVADRLKNGQSTSVLEIGLGTGLAMLLTLDQAISSDAILDYTAVENDWLGADVLKQLNLHECLSDSALAAEYLQWRDSLGPSVAAGHHTWQPRAKQTVTIIHNDARSTTLGSEGQYDAIYLDPFAPDTNPDLWQQDFLSRLHAVTQSEGALVTYCVNRNVKDNLAAAGFQVNRVRGPKGGKREVMRAVKRS